MTRRLKIWGCSVRTREPYNLDKLTTKKDIRTLMGKVSLERPWWAKLVSRTCTRLGYLSGPIVYIHQGTEKPSNLQSKAS